MRAAFEATRWRRKQAARLEAQAEQQDRAGHLRAASETWAAVWEIERELSRIYAARSVLASRVAIVLALVAIALNLAEGVL